MRFSRVCFSFALPISLALACAACGPSNQDQSLQTGPAPGQTAMNPAMNATAPTPMTPNPNAGMQNQSGAMTPAPAGSTGSAGFAGFATLAGAKGYIEKSDAMKDHWLNTHFDQCDSDHDGKLSHAEYDTCRNNPSATQTPQSSY